MSSSLPRSTPADQRVDPAAVLSFLETVIVTTAYTLDIQAVLDAMWSHLLPGLGTVSPCTGRARPAQCPAGRP